MLKDREPKRISLQDGSFKESLNPPATEAEARRMLTSTSLAIQSIKARGVTLGKYKATYRERKAQ